MRLLTASPLETKNIATEAAVPLRSDEARLRPHMLGRGRVLSCMEEQEISFNLCKRRNA